MYVKHIESNLSFWLNEYPEILLINCYLPTFVSVFEADLTIGTGLVPISAV